MCLFTVEILAVKKNVFHFLCLFLFLTSAPGVSPYVTGKSKAQRKSNTFTITNEGLLNKEVHNTQLA